MLNFVRRKSTALLVALALVVSLVPTMANAMPAAPARTSMDMAMTMADGSMHCDQKMPMPAHKAPCGDGATCLGMLGCATAAVVAPAVTPANFQLRKTSWPSQAALDGFFLRPALPPPIA